MSAAIIDIANAVADAINGQTFSPPYDAFLQAERLYLPDFKLTEITELKVVVVANSRASTLASRGRIQEMGYDIDIGFMKKLQAPIDSPETQGDVDALLQLVEEVGDFLLQMNNLPGLDATAIAMSNTPIYGPQELEQRAEFLSVLTLTYREFR